MADTGPRGPQGPAGTAIDFPVTIANGGTGATNAAGAREALQVESIGARASIPAGSDLNAYTALGNFCCASYADVEGLTNCPTAAPFVMTVGYANGSSYYMCQTIREAFNGTLYYRYYNTGSGEWGAWYKFAGVAMS